MGFIFTFAISLANISISFDNIVLTKVDETWEHSDSMTMKSNENEQSIKQVANTPMAYSNFPNNCLGSQTESELNWNVSNNPHYTGNL